MKNSKLCKKTRTVEKNIKDTNSSNWCYPEEPRYPFIRLRDLWISSVGDLAWIIRSEGGDPESIFSNFNELPKDLDLKFYSTVLVSGSSYILSNDEVARMNDIWMEPTLNSKDEELKSTGIQS